METRKLIAYLLILAIVLFLAGTTAYLTRTARARHRAERRSARKWREHAIVESRKANSD